MPSLQQRVKEIAFPENFVRSVRLVALSSNTHQVSIPQVILDELELKRGDRIKFEIPKHRKNSNNNNNNKQKKVTIVKFD